MSAANRGIKFSGIEVELVLELLDDLVEDIEESDEPTEEDEKDLGTAKSALDKVWKYKRHLDQREVSIRNQRDKARRERVSRLNFEDGPDVVDLTRYFEESQC